jgi:leucine dehydrogenase
MFKRMQSMQMQAVYCFQTISPAKHEYRAIIALHNTRLGPALGGCRCLNYAHEQLAFNDVMRLAQGMSFKAALANVPQGGGKAVILLPKNISPEDIEREFLFTWFGQCIEQLKGQYITAMDVGTQVSDMDTIAKQTSHVASASNIGDPADATAEGVIEGVKAALVFYFNDARLMERETSGSNIFEGRTFAIQGLGHVGWRIAKALINVGGKVVAADPDRKKCLHAESFGIKIVSTDEILTQACDVLIPCALGGIIDSENVSKLGCRIIAGSANNQLAEDSVAEILQQREILYAPDYIINAGGLIFASMQYNAKNSLLENSSNQINVETNVEIRQKIKGIYHTLIAIFHQAKVSGKNINQVANELAQQRLASGEGSLDKKSLDKGDVYDAA